MKFIVVFYTLKSIDIINIPYILTSIDINNIIYENLIF